MRYAVAALALFALSACTTPLSTHPVTPSTLGAPVSEASMLASLALPGVVEFEKVTVADWRFANTTHPPGESAWTTRELDAQIYFYAIRHPRFGLYLIDAGMPTDYEAHMGPLLRRVIRNDYAFHLRTATDDWLRAHGAPNAVFATHLHYDHVLGVVKLERSVGVYVGPDEGAQRNFFYRFINQPTREALAGRTLYAWRFAPAPQGELSIVDIFGDGSVFATYVPGHTPGSTAYVVNTPQGPQLITGDSVHSREGWSGELVEATGFETDLPQIHASIEALRALAARIPGVTLHPGHQSLE